MAGLVARCRYLTRAAALAACLHAAPIFAGDALPEVNIPVHVDALANGMQILTIENHKIPAVNHAVWYRVGAVDEPRGKGGMAHFLEHLLFKGTERFPKGTLSRMVARSGGEDNAFTMQETTGYYQYVPKDQLERMMEIEADRMQFATFSQGDVDSERQVVLEERLMRTDNEPESALWEQMQPALFLRHPYRNPVIGWAEEVKSLTRDDLLRFYRRHYAPSNAFVVIAGDVTREEAVALATKYYGNLPAAKALPRKETPVEPDVRMAETRLIVRDPRTDVASWARAYRTASYDKTAPGDAYAKEILADILGGGQDSPLYKELVTDKKLATDVSVYYSPAGLRYSTFSLSATAPDGKDVEETAKAADAFLRRDPSFWLTDDALDASRSRMLAERIFQSEDVRGLAFLYGKYFAVFGDVDYLQHRNDGLKAVTKDDLRRAFLSMRDDSRNADGFSLPLVGLGK
ncbi:MAG: pitrilysin family protein [Rickettsiales bacterium]